MRLAIFAAGLITVTLSASDTYPPPRFTDPDRIKKLESAMPEIDRIRARHASGNVFAVSHKGTIRVIICSLLGIDLSLYRSRIGQPVSAVTVFEFRPTGPHMRTMGDTSHLTARLRAELDA